MVPVLDMFEELEAQYAEGLTNEAALKMRDGYRGLQQVFAGKVERLGLKAMEVGALRLSVCVRA